MKGTNLRSFNSVIPWKQHPESLWKSCLQLISATDLSATPAQNIRHFPVIVSEMIFYTIVQL